MSAQEPIGPFEFRFSVAEDPSGALIVRFRNGYGCLAVLVALLGGLVWLVVR